MSMKPSRVTVALICVQLLALMTAVLAVTHYSDGTPGSHLTAGVLLLIGAVAVVLLGSVFIPVRHVLGWYQRPGLLIAIVVGVVVALVAAAIAAVLWTTPLLWLSRLTLAVLAIGLVAIATVGFVVAGWLSIRGGDTELGKHQLEFAVVGLFVMLLLPWFIS